MKKRLKSLGIPALVMFALAAVLLGGGMVGSTRAAVNYFSNEYYSEINLPSIGISLYENNVQVGQRDYTWTDADQASVSSAAAYDDSDNVGWTVEDTALLQHLSSADFELGTEYKEELTVRNTGKIPVYVRVILYRYWTEKDKDGNDVKVQALNPDYIELTLENTGEGGEWEIDEEASTRERTVLYRKQSLAAGDSSGAFTSSIKISEEVNNGTVKTKDGDYETTYSYSGKTFHLKAAVEAVQAKNGADAIKSSWGIDREVTDSGSAE